MSISGTTVFMSISAWNKISLRLSVSVAMQRSAENICYRQFIVQLGVEVEEVEWIPAADGGRPTMKPTGKKEVIEADMVLLAMGFLKPEQPKFAKNVFLAGDAETGASLVVRAMAGGRKAAAEIDAYLIQ